MEYTSHHLAIGYELITVGQAGSVVGVGSHYSFINWECPGLSGVFLRIVAICHPGAANSVLWSLMGYDEVCGDRRL